MFVGLNNIYIYNIWHCAYNIWHLHSLSIDESQGYVLEIRVSIRYTL